MSIHSGAPASASHAPGAPARPGASTHPGAAHAKTAADKGQSPFLALLAALSSDAAPMGACIAAFAAGDAPAADGEPLPGSAPVEINAALAGVAPPPTEASAALVGVAPPPAGASAALVGVAPPPAGASAALVGVAPPPAGASAALVGVAPPPAEASAALVGVAPPPTEANAALVGVAPTPAAEVAHDSTAPMQDSVAPAPLRHAPVAHEANRRTAPDALAAGTERAQTPAPADATDMASPREPRRPDLHTTLALGSVTLRNAANAEGARLAQERSAVHAASLPVAATSAQSAANASAAAGAWADGMLAASKALGNPRAADRATERSYVAVPGALPGVFAQDAASLGGASTPTPVFSIDGMGAAASAALADRLSYWVARGVQNAELSLDAFGGGVVDVSIAVQGQDAQVAFRSDAPELRQVLKDAMPQLEKLLGAEGLRLAGSFVGSSADNASGGAERRHPPSGARVARLRVEDGPGTAPALSARGVWVEGQTGRNVDLFV